MIDIRVKISELKEIHRQVVKAPMLLKVGKSEQMVDMMIDLLDCMAAELSALGEGHGCKK